MDGYLYDKLCNIPLMDVHTHMDASHICARDISDVALYHMVVSDLYSAGCPDGMRMSENPTNSEIEYRMERAAQFFGKIRNTSCYWGLKTILCELYGWEDDITPGNWRELDATIRGKARDPGWGREILKRAKIRRVCTEHWRGRGGIADDVFQYSLEWAFFTRNQWDQFDTALLELEHAWNQESPGAPLPVTVNRERLSMTKNIKSISDVHSAIEHYCSKIPYGEVLGTASHLSTDINYRLVSEDEMSKALANRVNAGVWERDVYANYISELFFSELAGKDRKLVLQFSLGAEPLPYETGSKLRPETVYELANLFARHRNLNFMIFLSELSQNQALCTLARELPNISLSAYWWHNFFPSIMRDVIDQRLDMLAMNRQVGFFSDAYCADWAYAKANIVRKQFSMVLEQRVAQGQYTVDESLEIASGILYDSAKQLLGMSEGQTAHERTKTVD